MTISAGTIIPYGGSSAPTGFLLCDGSAVSRTTYSTLFGVIGTTFGSGDGSTTFNVPDLRGRVVAGADNMGGTAANRLTSTTMSPDGDTLGATGGEETHTLVTAELASHTHTATVTDPDHSHDLPGDNTVASPSNIAALEQAGCNSVGGLVGTGTIAFHPTSASGQQLVSSEATGITVSNSNTGSDSAHNNVQPTLIVNYIIATQDASGTGTVTSVAMTGDGVVFNSTVSGSPVTTSGTLAPSLLTQTANTVLAGPTSGAAATPTFRALVGADLPNPSASTLGGVESYAAVAHQFLTSISTAGVPSSSQPSFSDISGTISSGQFPTTLQANILAIASLRG